jgi:hypothetical protein
MCGTFEGQVEGDAVLACWCHCGLRRQQTGAAMQLGVWPADKFKVLSGYDALVKYRSSGESKVFRNSCTKCGRYVRQEDRSIEQ